VLGNVDTFPNVGAPSASSPAPHATSVTNDTAVNKPQRDVTP
jgi:hypothetical protein